MRHRTHHFVSPRFTHVKLEPPFFRDVVDVFEDRMKYWFIGPAKLLLGAEHGEVAAVALTMPYFEGIEIYLSGEDSKGRSREFFMRGFRRVFPGFTGPEYLYERVASGLYESLRCGFAHDAMFRHGIYFSDVRKEPFTLTWPKKNGEYDLEGQLESAIVNPRSFVEGVERHFQNYVRELKAVGESEIKKKFQAAADVKWHLLSRERSIGLTEEEFYGAA